MGDVVVKALTGLVPAGIIRRDLVRENRTLRWIEAGTGDGPAVVLVAGRGETSLDWATVLPGLAVQARVVGYDRAGLGLSDPVRPLTLQGQIGDLAAVLNDVGPAVLVGHSWGGLLAQLVALRHPTLIAGLVLVDPSHEEVLASVPWPVRAAEAALGTAPVVLHRLGLSGLVIRGMARRLAARCSPDPRTRGLLADAYVACYATRSHLRAEARLAAASVPLARATRAGAVLPDVPVTVLSATTGLPPRLRARITAIHARLAASTPRGRHIIVDGAGHYIHHDQPETVINAICDTVNTVRQNTTE